MRWLVLLVVVGLAGCATPWIYPAMERQINLAEGCDDAKVIEQMGQVARVRVCGEVKTCRFSDDVQSWVCNNPQ